MLHAFEIGGRVAKFFDDVVHPYSRTGHAHEHFTRPGILDLFTRAGFRGAVASALITTTGRPGQVWGLVLVLYFLMATPIGWAARRLETALAARQRGRS